MTECEHEKTDVYLHGWKRGFDKGNVDGRLSERRRIIEMILDIDIPKDYIDDAVDVISNFTAYLLNKIKSGDEKCQAKIISRKS